MMDRVFLIILDSFGIGDAPDAAAFGDEGSNTLAAVAKSKEFHAPNLQKLGLFNIDKVPCLPKAAAPQGAFARLEEVSCGKDTTTGHWEIAGIESPKAMPVFPNGFPQSFIDAFEQAVGRKTLCNRPYSGTEVIKAYGEEHMRTGALIVYTSADSVFQIAANEAVVPLEELYRICEVARTMLTGDLAVGRVIARPFVGTTPENFARTPNRHDFSLAPPKPTVLDALAAAGKDVIGVGKIYDIFAGKGITEKIASKNNDEGMEITLQLAKRPFNGLAFINLVDFDMIYGHRNDVDGYARAISAFDVGLGKLLPLLGPRDVLMITADHGCDPSTPSTDHSRECVPFLLAGPAVRSGANLGTQVSFGCVANTIAQCFGLPQSYPGHSLWDAAAKK
ncbi:phosphopentomutase [Ruminococcaceae bacterium OttesenSCG-928-O06]|nr:phosphopentomutase [Ruminococcaceae bacterium OttesenSCG-928-O06]